MVKNGFRKILYSVIVFFLFREIDWEIERGIERDREIKRERDI